MTRQYKVSIAADCNTCASLMSYESNMTIIIHWDVFKEIHYNLMLSCLQKKCVLIVLSDNYDLDACVQALTVGADDYIDKTMLMRELHARIESIAYRFKSTVRNLRSSGQELYEFNGWHLDIIARRLTNPQSHSINMSSSEFDLLSLFVKNPSLVFTRDDLLALDSIHNIDPLNRRIDVQISRLRHKIEFESKKPKLIKTVRHIGYVFTAEVHFAS